MGNGWEGDWGWRAEAKQGPASVEEACAWYGPILCEKPHLYAPIQRAHRTQPPVVRRRKAVGAHSERPEGVGRSEVSEKNGREQGESKESTHLTTPRKWPGIVDVTSMGGWSDILSVAGFHTYARGERGCERSVASRG